MSISRRRVLVAALVALQVLVVLAPVVAWRPLIAPALYARVGEREAKEMIKGIAAYAYLQLAHPTPDLAPYTPMAYTDERPFGVNTFLEQEVEPAKVARSLDMIKDAGFHFVRQQFPWEDIEISAKGDFWDHKWNVSAWEKYDRIVEMAGERGLELIVRLDNPPAWSRADGDARGTLAPPDRVEDYGDFVAAVVSRYRGKVRYYQIWNEPNIFPEWGEQPVDAAAYTRLLQEAYRRAKAADPDCVIVSAALAQTLEQGPRNLSDLTFLQQMYEAGAKDYFDILGLQAYGLWTGPTDHRLGPDRTNFSRAQLTRAIMVRNGDAAKPIWATEVGWNAIPEEHPAPPTYGRVSREVQAQFAVEAYQRMQREWPWMGAMNYWFFKRATDTEQDQAFYYFGLLEPDFTPWPAYDALRECFQGEAVLYPGYQQESHWTLQYEGSWQGREDPDAVLGHYRLLDDGAALRFTFWGSALDLVCLAPTDPAALTVRIDGRPARVAASEVQGRPALALLRQLGPASHTVEIRVAPGHSLPLDGVLVRGEDRRGDLLAGAGMALALTATGWVVRRQIVRRSTTKGLQP